MSIAGPEEGQNKPPLFVELPTGLFTASGTWFHVTRDALDEYAGELLERVPIEQVVDEAERWLRSPATLALWLFAVSVLYVPGWQAALASLVWFAGWYLLSPGFFNRPMNAVLRLLQPVWVQGALYVGVLSWIANGDRIGAVAIGLIWFIGVRWGLLERLFKAAFGRVLSALYPLPVPDQVLRSVLVRHALALRIPLPQLEAMEKRMLSIAFRHKKRDSDS